MSFIPDKTLDFDNYKFTFGKYKGSYLSDVVEDDPGYIVWCLENIEWFCLKPGDEARVEEAVYRVGLFDDVIYEHLRDILNEVYYD